jgi:hypothetical protein
MGRFNPFSKKAADGSAATTTVPSPSQSINHDATKDVNESEKGNGGRVKSAIPSVTTRTIIMTILVSMGGFIFGPYWSNFLRRH